MVTEAKANISSRIELASLLREQAGQTEEGVHTLRIDPCDRPDKDKMILSSDGKKLEPYPVCQYKGMRGCELDGGPIATGEVLLCPKVAVTLTVSR